MQIESIRKGDIAEYEKLFHLYYKPLYLYAISFVNKEENAEDIVQEVFLNFWNKKVYNSVLNEKALKTYMFRAIRNNALNFIKKNDVMKLSVDIVAEDVLKEDFESYNEDLILEIKKEIEELPQQVREVVKSIFFSKLKYKEVAEEMEISVNSVKSYLRTGTKHLRDKFKDSVDVFLFYYLFKE